MNFTPELTKKLIRPTALGNSVGRNGAARFRGIEHGDGRCQREGRFFHRVGARFLQMIGAEIDRIPFRHFRRRERDHVGGEPERRFRRKDVGPAREIFLDDVVLRRAL